MGYGFRGGRYVLRGLREGRMSLVAFGILMVVGRMALRWRRRDRKVAGVRLEPGSSVALRVSRPGEDPVTFRVDADR